MDLNGRKLAMLMHYNRGNGIDNISDNHAANEMLNEGVASSPTHIKAKPHTQE